MKNIEPFLETLSETHRVWLLEAMDGMFAMLEDGDGNSYIPVWESEELARNAAVEDWADYKVTEMGFSELAVWLKELTRDEIDIAVSPEKEGEITALASTNFRKWVKKYSDNSYKEPDEEEEDDDDESGFVDTQYGPDDKSFDYGEGWAQPWQ